MTPTFSFSAVSVTDAVRWSAVRRRLREAGSRFSVPYVMDLERFDSPRSRIYCEVVMAFLPRHQQIIPIIFKRRKPDEPERPE